jgi:hypothetical protein
MVVMAGLPVLIVVLVLLLVAGFSMALTGAGGSAERHEGQNESNEHCPNKFIHDAKETVLTFKNETTGLRLQKR